MPTYNIPPLDEDGAKQYIRALGGKPPKECTPEWVDRVAQLERLEAKLCGTL